MPIYEYGCLACGAQFEKFMQTPTAVRCPTCESDRVSRPAVGGGREGGRADERRPVGADGRRRRLLRRGLRLPLTRPSPRAM